MTAITTTLSGEYERRFLELHEHAPLGGWQAQGMTAAERALPKDGRYKGPEWDRYCRLSTHRDRDKLVKRYSWAVPTVEALEVIAEYGPLVEVGAGTGYWTSLLRDRGVDVQAFERNPIYGNSYKHRQAYAAMARGNHLRALRMYPERTLLLCWAPYEDPMAAESLRLTRAEHVIWIGEIHGCNGNDEAMALLSEPGWRDDDDPPLPAALFVEERRVDLLPWPGVHDAVYIYRRIGA